MELTKKEPVNALHWQTKVTLIRLVHWFLTGFRAISTFYLHGDFLDKQWRTAIRRVIISHIWRTLKLWLKGLILLIFRSKNHIHVLLVNSFCSNKELVQAHELVGHILAYYKVVYYLGNEREPKQSCSIIIKLLSEKQRLSKNTFNLLSLISSCGQTVKKTFVELFLFCI